MDRSVAACAEAYVRALYVVALPDGGEAVMRLGRSCAPLASVMAARGVATACFLTAWNPRSEPRPDAENQADQDRLKAQIERLGLTWLAAEGRDPDGGWASEPSLVALGLTFEQACDLGDAYGQNAVLFSGADGAMRLVFCLLGRAET